MCIAEAVKNEECEVRAQSQGYDMTGITGTRWDSMKDWVRVTDCYRLCKSLYGEKGRKTPITRYFLTAQTYNI